MILFLKFSAVTNSDARPLPLAPDVSRLTSLFIQHNQSPDSGIFTLPVEKRRKNTHKGRAEGEKEEKRVQET